jgi:hypothetical protein
MTVKTIFTNADGQAMIVCEHCGITKSVRAAAFREFLKPLKVQCRCGATFFVRLELRKFYRKETRLNGEYSKLDSSGRSSVEKGKIFVEDLSRTGIGFCTTITHNMRVNEVVVVQFVLDDRQKTEIRKRAIVRRIEEQFIGAEFLDFDSYSNDNRTLGFYLMPR